LEAGRLSLGAGAGLGMEQLPGSILQLTEYYREVPGRDSASAGSR
jgi:hypothetical protein